MPKTSISRKISALLLLLFGLGAGIAVGAEFWSKKTPDSWSAKECRQLLSDSPWAKTVVLRHTILKQISRKTGEIQLDNSENQSEPAIEYRVSLRSAKPVRQAEARLLRLDKSADVELKEKQIAAFATTPDKIIFDVRYAATLMEGDRELAYYWQTQTLATFVDTVYLVAPDGTRIAPVAYWVGKGAQREFQFAFPREPVKKSESAGETISFEFLHPRLKTDVASEPRIQLKFRVKELVYDNTVTY